MPKFIAAIVTYNPNLERFTQCINSIVNQVDRLLIIDNNSSNKLFLKRIESKANISIIKSTQNEGLSKTYNKALNIAREENFSNLLILDQDTICESNIIEEFSKYINPIYTCLVPFRIHQNKDYQHHIYGSLVKQKKMTDSTIVHTAINSGTCINLSVLPQDFLFNEKLFVDCIDWDFYLRLHYCGHKVLRINTAQINVEIGNISKHHFLKYTWFAKNYSPKRLEICGKDFIVFLKMNIKFGWKVLKPHIIYTVWTYWMIIFEKNKFKKYIALSKGLFKGLFTKV